MATCKHGVELRTDVTYKFGACYECWCENNPSMCADRRKRVLAARAIGRSIPAQTRGGAAQPRFISRVTKPLPCIYVGAPVRPPDGKPTTKDWRSCDHEYKEGDPRHPGFAAGTPQCPCVGCGPNCRGYVADEPEMPVPQTGLRGSAFVGRREGAPLRWSYGVTTVPMRRRTTLPKTLMSLRTAGFDSPHLFVDGDDDCTWKQEFGLEATVRPARVRTFGNWVLALWELYTLSPWSDRYAVFQDDFVTYRNLRPYLDALAYPGELQRSGPDDVRQQTDAATRGYINLYTFPSNQKLAPQGHVGLYRSNQFGRGAVGLVFSREAVVALLSSEHIAARPINKHRGHKSVDGGIVDAMKKAGWSEYVHNPSLTQHMDGASATGNRPQLKAVSFRGEDFDAMELLRAG